jgi:carboxypeptidase Taq
MKTADVKVIFDGLRPKQVELIKAITSSKQVKNDFLHKKYNEQKLWDFGVDVVGKFGYDWSRGRQDKAPHPFETTFSVNDVRITTRFEADNPMATLFSTMHESGHAMYEQGVDPQYERTPLESGTSLAVHESQSRMWENLVGRSLPFWEHFYPKLKKVFPSQLSGVSLKSFYKGINKVEPSLIRVNADEATYNTKMKEYLGVTPPNDAKGVLQDIHWSGGAIGYFSTYALGNLVSAQLWEKINKDIRGLDDQIRKGDELLGWLRKNIHQHGQKFEPQTLVQNVTGSKITPEPYVRYLTKKYSEIYGF